MSRIARKVAHEIADKLAQMEHNPHLVVCEPTLQRWFLMLSPPRKKRAKDPARAARRSTMKELDALCRRIVFARDGGRCRKCGKPASEWSHVVTRGNHSVRFSPSNSWASCGYCHRWWHANRKLGKLWFDQEFGAGSFDALKLEAQRPKVDMAKVERELREMA